MMGLGALARGFARCMRTLLDLELQTFYSTRLLALQKMMRSVFIS
jgi:hypothetical protein